MYPKPTHLPNPRYSPSAPVTSLPQRKQTNKISPWKLSSVTQYPPLPKQLYLLCSLQISVFTSLGGLSRAGLLMPPGPPLQTRGGASSPELTPSRLAHPPPHHQGQFCASQAWSGPTPLLSCAHSLGPALLRPCHPTLILSGFIQTLFY